MMVRATAPRERLLMGRTFAEFSRVTALAAAAVKNGTDPEAALSGHGARMGVILSAAYKTAAPLFSSMVFDAVGKSNKGARDVFEELVIEWIRKYSAIRADDISRTTAKALRNVIANARSEGLTVTAVAQRVRNDFGNVVSRSRSLTISRTEIHSAANAAQDIATESLGRDDLQREWIAAGDERTRDDHVNADGQVVRVGEPFDVGGDSLMYPGDPSGSAEQIINCRCVVGLLTP